MLLKKLRKTHPSYDAKEWRLIKAIYIGGKALLRDPAAMAELFPAHLSEHKLVYQERVKRAFYLPYFAEVLGNISAGVFSESLEYAIGDEELSDQYYKDFLTDCSPPGGQRCSFYQFLRDTLTDALKFKRAWALIDFPQEDLAPTNLAEEQERGLDRAYVIPLDIESVLDWEIDKLTKEFKWVIVRDIEQCRETPEDERDIVEEIFTVWYPTHWERYAIRYKIDNPPKPDVDVPLVASANHTFNRVPILCLDLKDDLAAGEKIFSACVAHFNLRNGLSWAEYKSLFPVPVAFLDAQNPLNPATDDPARAVTQTYGQGHMPTMAAGDRIEFVGPDSQPYSIALQDLAGLRDEIHRVLMQMAASVDNSGAALKRSGDSKAMDMQLTAKLLEAYANEVKELGLRILRTIEVGRSETPADWQAVGMSDYAGATLDGLLERAEIVDAVSIPSATFKRAWCFVLAQRLLGTGATREQLEEIKSELEENITNEQFLAPDPLEDPLGAPAPGGAPAKPKIPKPAKKPGGASKPDKL